MTWIDLNHGNGNQEIVIGLHETQIRRSLSPLATSLPIVKQIIAAGGYKSKSHFVRDFRRSFRVAPSEYRKSVSS